MRRAAISRTWILGLVGGAALALGMSGGRASAAETADVTPMSKTVLTIKVAAADAPSTRSRFISDPPTIVLEFPGQRVTGWLPDEAAQGGGVITRIAAEYGGRSKAAKPVIRSLRIMLSGPYGHRVRADAGRIVVEIDHPASVTGGAVEIGLRNRFAPGQELAHQRFERFRAMQQALASVTPTPWMLSIHTGDAQSFSPAAQSPLSAAPAPRASAGPEPQHPRSRAPSRPSTLRPTAPFPWRAWVGLMAGVLALAGAGLWGFRNYRDLLAWWRPAVDAAAGRVPSGMQLIDELVWSAFERQGYALLAEQELVPSPGGPLRIAMRDSVKIGVLFAGQGPFFEKRTIERFVRALSETDVEQGILVASGAFTVPAQRLAKEHRITLIGRDQLVELLGTGARSETATRQLELQQAQLDEAKATLKQYADELEALRKQRNEASWLLGDQQARAAAFEQELETLRQEVSRRQGELERWGQDAAQLKKQWEESQWYLGESRARAKHLEAQLAALEETVKGRAETEQQRDEALQRLAEERTARQSLEQHAADLARQFDESAEARERLEAQVTRLSRELAALREFGERRNAFRGSLPSIHIELWDGAPEPLFRGAARDLSRHGLGLTTEDVIQSLRPLRARLFLPGLTEPLESTAELRWQQATGEGSRHDSGYRLSGLTERAEDAIELLLGHDA